MMAKSNEALEWENRRLRKELDVFRRENGSLKQSNKDLKRENRELRRLIESATRRSGDLARASHGALEEARRFQDKLEVVEAELKEQTVRAEAAEEAKSAIEEKLVKTLKILNADSTNSSRPPSTDQKGRKKKKKAAEAQSETEPARKAPNEHNTRVKTERSKGGQPDHIGTTLTVEKIKELIENGLCVLDGEPIDVGCGGGWRMRYELDLETVMKVRRYRVYDYDEEGNSISLAGWKTPVVYGHNLRAMTAQLYALGVMSNDKIHEFLRAITGDALPISAGTVYGMLRKMASLAEPAIEGIKKEMLTEPVVFTDATNISVNGEPAYVRNFSTLKNELLVPMSSKSLEALRKIDFLIAYMGILMHDHELGIYHFGGGHAECNVHLDRYLVGISQITENGCAEEFRSLLYEIKDAVEKAGGVLDEAACEEYSRRYDEVLARWREKAKTTRFKCVAADERKLINRLEKYKENHLLFMRVREVPFSNNHSERAVRRPKLHSKVTGGFRLNEGNKMCCDLMSITATARLRGMSTFQVLLQISQSEKRVDGIAAASPLVFEEAA